MKFMFGIFLLVVSCTILIAQAKICHLELKAEIKILPTAVIKLIDEAWVSNQITVNLITATAGPRNILLDRFISEISFGSCQSVKIAFQIEANNYTKNVSTSFAIFNSLG